MTGRLKPFSSFKESGVSSIGAIPTHWRVAPLAQLGWLFKGNGGTKADEVETGVPCIRYGDLYTQHEFFIRKSRACVTQERAIAYRLIEYGDVLFAASGETIDDIGRSAVNLIHGGVRCGGDVIVFRKSSDLFGPFLGYACDARPSRVQKAMMGRGFTVVHIYGSDLKRLMIAIPPADEQGAIVRYLDHADAKINRYIRAKKKLIGLLNEQKQAIIHRAITRGLDPNVKLKPSGVEWLGDVPEHWKLKRFKFLATITSGQVDPRKPQHKDKILVAPNHIRTGAGKITHQQTAEEQGADSGKYEVRSGQIIYSKIRPNLRKAAIAPVDCICSADMYPISVRPGELRPAFLLLLLLSAPFTKYAIDCSLRVAMPKVNREALGECWVWYPNLEEQDWIVASITKDVAPSDAAIASAEREIELLREYRSRLVADLVTGKLDVREAAAKLPDVSAEPRVLDETEDLLQDDSMAEGIEPEAEDEAA